MTRPSYAVGALVASAIVLGVAAGVARADCDHSCPTSEWDGQGCCPARKQQPPPPPPPPQKTPVKPPAQKPGPAKLAIRGDASVEGARVIVDGQTRGVAPIVVETIPGKHHVEMTKVGFISDERWVTVSPGETQQVAFSLVSVDPAPTPPAPAPTRAPMTVAIVGAQIRISEQVHFQTGAGTIVPSSFPLLDEVARLLAEHADIGLLQVGGHTDNRGAASYNHKLSQVRAESVVAYLVGKGIDRKRLVAKGFGEDQPIASNETQEGRLANRRIELVILSEPPAH